MKRIATTILLLATFLVSAHAVLKERNLEQTLSVLREELTQSFTELNQQAEQRKQQTRGIIQQLRETIKSSNQNALMLYSQHTNQVFDLTYACHQATEQYMNFQQQQLPFKSFVTQTDQEIAKYDSLVMSLRHIRPTMLDTQAATDRTVCLTLAISIRNTLQQTRSQVAEYITLYEMTEQRLKYLNDYANRRYNDIQTGIFRNGGESYFSLISNFGQRWKEVRTAVTEKYRPGDRPSDWDGKVIINLFAMVAFYIIVVILLNLLAFKFMPRRFHTREFIRKRPFIIMATTTVTFALVLGVMLNTLDQNFYIMASSLLIEYAWLLAVIFISLLLRVEGRQIASAFRIYAPLILVGFIVIAFRIILVPNELVSMLFPMILLLCTLWQWWVIRRHNRNIPRSDIFYTYISMSIFVVSLVCSWAGYTLMAVQILIWWIMQLTCILTITCISSYLNFYSKRHHYDEKPITSTWLFLLVSKVLLPIIGVCSVMVSIYWAADVFNLGDLCWKIFNKNFINLENLKVSMIKLAMVVNLWFIAAYVVRTVLSLMRHHFQANDPSTAASREVMGKNVIQVLVWGVWALFSLSLLHVSVAWLLAISGGLSTGIGFASKDIIENIYYGATLMAGRVKVGDWIQVDGTMGKVTSISYTSTVVESLYGEIITFQNSQLFAKNYKNLTRNHGYVLAAIDFSVAYGSNLKQVTTLVEDAVNSMEHEWMEPGKKVKTVVSSMGESSVDFKLYAWADAVKKVYVVSDILKTIYDTLYANGIEIPFPQRDIHIKQ
ncbi:MAG: mechanosensitive ion channel [Prevotella sp.]|nr:mechanosensitive ion channel [Prevotella sp.]